MASATTAICPVKDARTADGRTVLPVGFTKTCSNITHLLAARGALGGAGQPRALNRHSMAALVDTSAKQ